MGICPCPMFSYKWPFRFTSPKEKHIKMPRMHLQAKEQEKKIFISPNNQNLKTSHWSNKSIECIFRKNLFRFLHLIGHKANFNANTAKWNGHFNGKRFLRNQLAIDWNLIRKQITQRDGIFVVRFWLFTTSFVRYGFIALFNLLLKIIVFQHNENNNNSTTRQITVSRIAAVVVVICLFVTFQFHVRPRTIHSFRIRIDASSNIRHTYQYVGHMWLGTSRFFTLRRMT